MLDKLKQFFVNLEEKAKQDWKLIWNSDKGYIFVFGALVAIVKFRDLIISLLLNSAKKIDENAKKQDAALAVPDWPLSYGTITPPMVGGIAYEHTHRVIAAGLGLLIIGRNAGLAESERARLKWRTEKVRVDSHAIDCLTFDDLYGYLQRRMNYYSEAPKFE